MSKSTANSDFNFVWTSIYVLTLLLWGPILLFYPLVFIGSTTTVGWFVASARVSKVLTWFVVLPIGQVAVAYVTLGNGESGYTGSLQGLVIFFIYTIIGINTFTMQYVTVPKIITWY